MTDATFRRWLLAIAAAGLVPTLVLSTYQFIDFDGWWHVFIATQDRWLMLLGEWKYEAHPPLYYLLLRMVAAISHSHLALRSIGIVCSFASTYVIGMIGAKLYRHKSSALLLAAAYTFAWSIIDLNCAVRAYTPALLFVLLAFSAYLDWPLDPRSITRFGIYSAVALLFEYYAVFFLAGIAVMMLVRIRIFLESLRSQPKRWLIAVGMIIAMLLFFVATQMVVQAESHPYLAPFLYHPESPLGLDGFVISNLEKEFALFTPFGLNPYIFALPFVVTLLIWRLRIDLPVLILVPMLLILVLSIFGKHPFGGEFRHQSIMAPFIFITAFLLIDRLPVRALVTAATGLAIAASFAWGCTTYKWSTIEPRAEEYAQFRSHFPDASAIYSDATSVLHLYGQTHRSRWIFQDRFLVDENRVVSYVVDDRSGHTLRVLRNKFDLWFDLTRPSTYQVAADTLRHENLRSAVFFFNSIGWNRGATKLLEDSFRTLAPQSGLIPGRGIFGDTYAFVEITLR